MGKRLGILPYLGIVMFLGLYFYSAMLYPGGTRFDRSTRGYSHLNNYWCDLLDAKTYSGEQNPGRPFALAGTFILPLSLSFFWYNVPRLFKFSIAKGLLVRFSGCLSMILATLISTRAHDIAINTAAPLGFVALITTQVGLFRSKEIVSLVLSLVSITFCVANFLMWRTGFALDLMPIVQKLAFASFFVWVGFTTNRFLSEK